MTIEDKKKIINVLKERHISFQCPICKSSRFTMLDGYASDQVLDDYYKILLDGRSLPSIVLICNTCGFVSKHALGALGLLEKKNKE